jgi:guanyl-specific ribonuclease Sa
MLIFSNSINLFQTYRVYFIRLIILLFSCSTVSHACISTVFIKPGMSTIDIAELPKEGQKTLRLIQSGGPFPHPEKDGSVFGNRERTLPAQPRGYYTEYTVKTPSVKHRGARRIVAGKGMTGNPATSNEYFYTEDHYNTFKQITFATKSNFFGFSRQKCPQ